MNWSVRGLAFGNRLLNLLFHPEPGKLYRAIQILWLGGLFFTGAGLWFFFLDGGNLNFDFLDWAEVNGPRMAIMQDAARQGILPLHTNNPSGLRGVTDRFLAIADTPFSPQFYALKFLSLGQFMLFNTLLLYAVGFVGLLLLHHQQRLSLFVTTILFLLFNFNGHITSHLAVGHTNWTGHFLLPFFVLLALQLVEKPWGWRWVCSLALTMLAIFLQGDFHLYVWCLIFLGILGIAYPRLLPAVLTGGVAIALVSMARILPPILELGKMDSEFKNGFSSVLDIVAALGVLSGPEVSYQGLNILNLTAVWEKDTYTGLVGLAFLAIFGMYRALKARSEKNESANPYYKLLAPSLLLTILSYGTLYKVIALLAPIPIFSGERVTSRFLIVPVVVVASVGAIYLQRLIDQREHSPLEKLVYLSLVFLLGLDLLQHLKLWRIEEISAMVELFPKIPFDPAAHGAITRVDLPYSNAILAGGLVSLAALGILIGLAWRERQKS